MVYQRKKRSHEQHEQLPVNTVQNNLFASPDLETDDADDSPYVTQSTAGPSLEDYRRIVSQAPAYDFGSISRFPKEEAVRQEPTIPLVQAKRMSPEEDAAQQEPQIPLAQAKLTVGAADDKYEQEADRVAAKVVDTINSPQTKAPLQRTTDRANEAALPMQPLEHIQRQAQEEEADLQMKPTPGQIGTEGGAVSTNFASKIERAKGGGQALDPGLQQNMGQAMGADFSDVKIHTDTQSDQLNQTIQAKAFTTGQDVFFRQGEYNPGSKDGQRLIAHELTHVVQQNGPSMSRTEHSIQTKPVTISQSSHGTLIQRGMRISKARLDNNYRSYYEVYKKIKHEFPINFMEKIIVPKYNYIYNPYSAISSGSLKEKAVKAIEKRMEDGNAYPSDNLAVDVMDLAPTLVAEKKDSIIEQPKKLAEEKGGKITRKFAQKFLDERLKGAVYNSLEKTEIKTENNESVEDFKIRISKEVNTILERIWEKEVYIYDTEITQEMEALTEGKFVENKVEAQAEKAGDKEYKKLENSTVLQDIMDGLENKIFNYKIDIMLAIKYKLDKKLPVSKTKLFENDDNKQIRQHVKDKARELAKNTISEAISKQVDANKMPATYKYLKMKANKKGYKKDAKDAANKVLDDLTITGAHQAFHKHNIGYFMEKTVRQAAWSKLRIEDQPSKQSKHKQAATKYAVNQLDKFFKEHKDNAKTYASEWQKQYLDDFQKKPATKAKLDKNTKKQVNEIVSKITAESPEHSMSILSKLIDTFVPDPGDQVSLNVELKIPISGSPAYILLGVKGTAARGLSGVVNAAPELDADNDRVEVRGDFTFGAGAQFLGGEADGSLSVFLRAGAADSIKATQAMSYGLYRFLAKKKATQRMANWWGGTGNSSTGMKKAERAETWAAMVEEQVFKGGGIVDTGIGIRGRAKAGITENAELGASIGGAYFTRYNKDEDSIGAQLGQSPKNQNAAKKRQKDIRGKGFWAFGAKFTGKFSKLMTGAGASVSYTAAWSGGKLKTWELSFSGDLGLGKSDDIPYIANQATQGLGKAIAKLARLLNENKSEPDKSDKLRAAASSLTSFKSTIDATAKPEIENKLSSLYEFDAPESKTVTGNIISPAKTKKGIASTKKVRVKIAVGLSGGKRVSRVAIYEVSTTQAKIPGLGGVTYEKSRRVGSGSFSYELVKEYKLNLVKLKSTANIPRAKGSVCAAKVGNAYYIRIFDKNGNKVASKDKKISSDNQLTSKLDEALKNKDKISNSKAISLKKDIASYLEYSSKNEFGGSLL